MADAAVERKEEGLEITKKASKELKEMYEKVQLILEESLEMFSKGEKTYLGEILRLENEIDQMERDLQKSHVRRMSKGKCSPEAGMVFTDLTTGLERVADHATNIAFSILERDPEEDDVEVE